MTEISAKTETITPEHAKSLLASHNGYNRKVSPQLVKQYARLMRTGQWKPYVAPGIIVDIDGRIANGQHTLLAIAQGDRAVSTWVQRNVPADTRYYIDSGRKRTLADNLRMLGKENGEELIVTPGNETGYLNMILELISNLSTVRLTTTEEMVAFRDIFYGSMIDIYSIVKGATKWSSAPFVAPFIIYGMIDGPRVSDLARRVFNNDSLQVDSPEHGLHRYVTGSSFGGSKSGGRERINSARRIIGFIDQYLDGYEKFNSPKAYERMRNYCANLTEVKDFLNKFGRNSESATTATPDKGE